MLIEPDDRHLDTIVRLLRVEARAGHFDPQLRRPPAIARMETNLEAILTRGRRVDQPLRAQLIAWRPGPRVLGWIINSEILPGAGNELWMLLIRPEARRQGEGGRMLDAALGALSSVDVFVRCYPRSTGMLGLLRSRGFAVLRENGDGTRELKRPSDPAAPLWAGPNRQKLAAFVPISIPTPAIPEPGRPPPGPL